MALEVGVPTNPYHDPTGSLEGSRDTEEGIVVSTQPDICLTPNGAAMVAVGYNIWAKQADDARTTPTVKLTSLRSHNMGSFITTCHGDEAGVGGGTKSGTHNGICEPKEHSATVFSEGKQMIRHTDEWWMNNRNTVGKLIYVKDADAYGRWWEKQTGKVQLALLDTGVKSDASGFTASAPELSEAEIAAQTRAAETELAEGAAELAASTGLQEVAAGEAEGGLVPNSGHWNGSGRARSQGALRLMPCTCAARRTRKWPRPRQNWRFWRLWPLRKRSRSFASLERKTTRKNAVSLLTRSTKGQLVPVKLASPVRTRSRTTV